MLQVYYYVITEQAPFTVGCFGPVASVEECRSLHSTCEDGDTFRVETRWGAGEYDLDCPCFDELGSNIEGQGRPGYLPPLGEGASTSASVSPAPAPSGAGAHESSPAFAVLGVGAAAMALVGVGRLAVSRRYAGKEGHVLPSWRSLWGERSYRRLASEEAEEPGRERFPRPRLGRGLQLLAYEGRLGP